ncbi:DivIVA domain-containing protein [Lysinibacter cavernae]|uniref:DivIVA domain-containing protein n=1 Tax=Lysinibacter cavernae TaxID=1640652 RepID=A0A7X5TUJ0_9MICO|nr:DivIVA domain-containing protein [Lysinibacter cavernae]NIH54609.1 DivIVA domain-containing protein [Lysinibacter cavernae]
MITAAETHKVKFHITKFRAGFSLDEVDDALDSIARTLEIYEGTPGMLASSG